MRLATANALLLALVTLQVATGVLWFLVNTPERALFFAIHRWGGIALALALAWKLRLVLPPLRLKLRRAVPFVALWLALLVAAIVLSGGSWVAADAIVVLPGGVTLLSAHIWLTIAALPLFLWHVLPSPRRRLPRPRVVGRYLASRRAALGLLGGAGLAALGWAAIEPKWQLTALAAGRRQTGSREVDSYKGNSFPTTTWLLDRQPPIDAAAWRLRVTGRVAAPLTLTLDDLAAYADRLTATLDCTSGWYTTQEWRGALVHRLLDHAGVLDGASGVTIRAATDYAWSFPLAEARGCLLATHVQGEPLTPQHGFPLRLVAPSRRGFQWVKWVTEIEVA